MPKAFGKFECPCGGIEWGILICLDTDSLEELICTSCGNAAKITVTFVSKAEAAPH